MEDYLFISENHGCKIDSKGRVLLPAKLKKQLAGSLNDGFVLKRSVFHHCLELYPMQEWKKEAAEISKLNRFVEKNVKFIRRFMAGVTVVELDNQDRFLIPKELIKVASLKKEIMLSSAVTKIEIWDKDLYEQDLMDIDDFKSLAEEVMGDL